MEYPHVVTVESSKLEQLLKQKGDLILEGRELTNEIEECETQMKAADEAIQEIEKTVDVSDLDAQAKIITESMNAILQQMEGLKKEHYARLKKAVSPEAVSLYEDTKKKKEELEQKRNKIGLKVQKINDKIIPLGRQLMKPFLTDEFEDYDTLRLEDGKIVGTIFNHLETFKENFAKTRQKK